MNTIVKIEPTCSRPELAKMLKELIADMHLSTGDCVGGAWATCGPYTSPLSPADELRRQAKDIEARDALLTRARALVQQCNEK